MTLLPVTILFASSAGATVLTITDTGVAPVTSGYRIVSLAVAGQQTRRDTTTAPDVGGALETSSVPDESSYGIVIEARHTTHTALQTLVDAVTAAATARAWRLTVTIGGSAQTWRCRRASWDAPVETPAAWSVRRNITLTIPVDPYPI
jgi:hypothetical protein